MIDGDIRKLMEIQYLKGRLDELYKGYVPASSTRDSRIVDYRISKYEEKLKKLDEVGFFLYQVERENQRFSKSKSKKKMEELLTKILPKIKDKDLKLEIQNQINSYK